MALVRCLTCKQQCEKPYQLPECGHTFCKKCLKDYLSSQSSWNDELNYSYCPVCGKKIEKPTEDLPVSKWIKQFKIHDTSTFFTHISDTLLEEEMETGSDFVPLTEEKFNMATVSGARTVKSSTCYTRSKSLISRDKRFNQSDTGGDGVRFRETSNVKHRSLNRAAMRISKYTFEKAFESKISSDKKDCVYFGGDTMHNGNLLLSDWLNITVKMFEPSGQFVCKLQIDDPPLDVTEVGKDLIVVSFGTTVKMVIFLRYLETEKELKLLGGNSLQGFLYNTTRCEDKCVGIFERDDSKGCSIVEVSIDKFVKKSGNPRHSVKDLITSEKNIEIASESGICYNHADRKLYVTSRRKLMCFRKDRRLIFRRSYVRNNSGLYILGSVTCDDDERGLVYIASDYSILRVNKDGDLISVVQLPEDPYHITTTQDKRKVAIIGKQNEILYFNIEKRKTLTVSS